MYALDKAEAEGLTVREVRSMVRDLRQGITKARPLRRSPPGARGL